MLTLQALAIFAAVKGDATAVEFNAGDLSWRQLHNSVSNKVTVLLREFKGNIPRQAVYLSENGPNLIAWLGACATLGVTATGLDHTADPQALRETIGRLNPDLVLLSQHLEREAGIEVGFGAVPVFMFDPFTVSDQAEGKAPDLAKVLPLAFRSVVVTSGTTGRPKLAVRTESFEKRRFSYFSERFRLDGRDRFLACIPIHHAAGNGWIRFTLSLGGTVVLADKDDGATLANAVYRKGISTAVLTPILLDRIVDAINRGSYGGRPEQLRWVLVGGKNFTPHQKRRSIEALGVVYEYYGTTETGVNTLADPVDLLLHPRSVGKVFSGNDIVIVGPHDRPLKAGETGAVAVASYMNMAAYTDAPAHEIHLGGRRYLVTPDQGNLDEDGRLYLKNRLSRPEAVVDLYGLEDEIRAIESVRDVILHQDRAAAPDEICCALVSTEPAAVETLVRGLARQRGLSLTGFRLVEEIPYSPTGKVRVEFIESALVNQRRQS